MNLKKILLVGLAVTVLVSFPIHFMYNWFPNVLSSIFFPVNESIWEHMKILYTSLLIGGITEGVLAKRYDVKVNNKGLAVVVSCFSSIILYLVIYLPINYFWGESLWLSIGLMVVVYGVMELVKLVIYQKRSYSALNKTSIWLIILGYIVFINWTYKPIYNDLFYDSYNGKYGIDEYICQN